MQVPMSLPRLAVLVFALLSGVAVAVNFYVESRRPLLAASQMVGRECVAEDWMAPEHLDMTPDVPPGLKTGEA